LKKTQKSGVQKKKQKKTLMNKVMNSGNAKSGECSIPEFEQN
jgi:hypothetical protein